MRDHFGNNLLSSNLNFARGIFILEDCEGTCNWEKYYDDANATITFENAAAWSGTNGLQLFSGDDAPAADQQIAAVKSHGLSSNGKMVMRCKIGSTDITKIKYFSLWLSISNGSNTFWAAVRYYPNTPKFVYLDDSGSEVAIPALAFTIANNAFVTLELVIDTYVMQYVSTEFSGISQNLEGINFQNAGVTSAVMCISIIKAVTIGANALTVYADNIYVGEYDNI